MIIDAKNKIVGRVATYAAKQALLGHSVHVVNCKDSVMTGNRKKILERYEQKRSMGVHSKGPFHIRTPERLVKRIIRGMLPKHRARGYDAMARVRCYNSIPANLQDKETIKLEKADVGKTSTTFVYISTITKHLGGKE